MSIDDYFRIVMQKMRMQSTYSPSHHAWVLSALSAQIILYQNAALLPSDVGAFHELLEDGVRRGMWYIDIDESGMGIVVLK